MTSFIVRFFPNYAFFGNFNGFTEHNDAIFALCTTRFMWNVYGIDKSNVFMCDSAWEKASIDLVNGFSFVYRPFYL